MVGGSCYLVDAGKSRVLDLGKMVLDPDRLAAVVTAKLLRKLNMKSAQQLRTTRTFVEPVRNRVGRAVGFSNEWPGIPSADRVTSGQFFTHGGLDWWSGRAPGSP
jgi:hypothetical protein